ncbi:MAG: hypothetical protein AB8G86_14625 [Saprospiraceae bacterium]
MIANRCFAFDYTFPNRRNGDLLNIHLGIAPNTIETVAAEYFTADYLTGDIRPRITRQPV